MRADQLHEAPILCISGNEVLSFTDDEKNKLRTFVEQGGMILGTADCNSMVFSRSFEKLGTELFKKYEFRQLSPGHLIFTGEQYPAQKWKLHPRVMALSNGVREMMILLNSGDAGRVWQSDNPVHPEFFELGTNIFLYSTERQNLRFRGEPYVVLPMRRFLRNISKSPGFRPMATGTPNPVAGSGWQQSFTTPAARSSISTR